MLMRITFWIAAIISLTGITAHRYIQLRRGYITIVVMVISETGTVVTIMMFDQTRTSMNTPENKRDSYQHQE